MSYRTLAGMERDPWAGVTILQQNQHSFLGDALDDEAAGADDDGSGDADLTQLHALAVAIVNLRNYFNGQLSLVSNADGSPDLQGMTQAVQSIASLQGQFKTIAARRAATNPYALTGLDATVEAIGTWAQNALNALPSALAAVPDALVNALAQVVRNTGTSAVSAFSPLLIGAAVVGAALIFGAKQAETTRTYRKYVA